MLRHDNRSKLQNEFGFKLKPLSGFLANYFAARKNLNAAKQGDMFKALSEASPHLFNTVGSNLHNELKPTNECQLGLPDFSNMPDSALLDQRQAAAFLRLSEHALQSWRTTGHYALPYTKCGRRVFYTAGALRAFMASRTFTHTGAQK